MSVVLPIAVFEVPFVRRVGAKGPTATLWLPNSRLFSALAPTAALLPDVQEGDKVDGESVMAGGVVEVTVNVTAMVCGLFVAFASLTVIVAF